MISSLVTPPLYPHVGMKSSPGNYPLRGTRLAHNRGMSKSLRAVLAANVKARRTELGMGQEDVEEKSGFVVGQSSISRIEKGQTPISLDKLEAVAKALRCHPWELLVDDEAIREAAIRRALDRS